MTTISAGSGPTAVQGRALGPDLARGLLLLFIALANTHGFLHPEGVTTIRQTPIASTLADQLVAFAEVVFVDGRSYTMFAALFGYGLVQVMTRQQQAGLDWNGVKRILRRRGWWLLVIGLLHNVLLYYGDILAAYAVLALLFQPVLRWSPKRLLVFAGFWIVLGSCLYGLASTPVSDDLANQVMPWATEQNPLKAIVQRAVGIPVSLPVLVITSAGAFLIGVAAARLRTLEQPELYRRLLWKVVLIGLPLSTLGGIPLALSVAGIIDDPSIGDTFPAATLHALTGFAGGPAYAALIALWSIGRRPTGLVGALQATGQRSLTCYLSQSVVWAVVFPPYLLDLGHRISLWQSAVLAIATWAATVGLAAWLRRTGRRGPFEVLLRKLTYKT